MAPDDKVAAIRDYLTNEFRGGEVAVDDEAAGIVYRVTAGSSKFAVTVVREFLEGHTAPDIRELLSRWNVGSELRRTDGLPMVISKEGLRLASSN